MNPHTQLEISMVTAPVVMAVTPQLAAEWLATVNTHNRTLREGKIAAYARDMSNGAWIFNGDVIRFADDGTLIDGQHRLAAIVRSGVTCRFIVVGGLDPRAQDTVDIGAHRSLRDQLSLAEMPNPGELSGVARRVLIYEQNRGVRGSSSNPTHAEMITYIEAHKDIHRGAEVATQARRRRVPTAPSVIGAAYVLCARRSFEQAEEFFVRQVIENIGVEQFSPAWALDRRLKAEVTQGGRQMAPDNAFRYCLLAWNHYRVGSQITKLQGPKGGWTGDNMPEPR